MKIKPQLLFIFTVLGLSVYGQVTDTIDRHNRVYTRSIQLLTGFTFGRSKFVEIGVAKNIRTLLGPHASSSTIFVSTEMKVGDKFIMGPKIGCWSAGGVGGIAMGANMIYYTDFDNGTLVFRPEIGFGLNCCKFVYGYNVRLTKNILEGINYSVGSIFIGIPVKKLKDKVILIGN